MSLLERTETHFISEEHPFYKWAIAECGRAASLWNKTLYIYRNAFTGHHENIEEYADLIRDEKYVYAYDVIKRMRKLKDVDFYSMVKPNVGMCIVISVDQAWRSWARSVAAYRQDPSKFKAFPKMPNYKRKAKDGGTHIVPFTYVEAKLQKDGTINIKRNIKLPIKTRAKKIQQVRFVPVIGGINIEVIYKKEIKEYQLDTTRAIGVDLGVDNLMAITSNVKAQSMLVNGRQLKSYNSYFNKEIAKVKSNLAIHGLKDSKKLRYLWRKRNHVVKDYLHKASRFLVNQCIDNNIGTIIVGHNTGWKNEVNMGKENNRNFVHIPHSALINMLRYKVEEIGGRLIEINESHTSKCSFLDDEKICHHDKYIGKRVKRGLFKTAKDQLINADINGSLNITKRGMGASFTHDKSVFNPIKIDISSHLKGECNGILAMPKSSNRLECLTSPILDTVV